MSKSNLLFIVSLFPILVMARGRSTTTTPTLSPFNVEESVQQMNEQMKGQMEEFRRQFDENSRQEWNQFQNTLSRDRCTSRGGVWNESTNNCDTLRQQGVYGQQCQQTTDKAVSDCDFDENSEVKGVSGILAGLKQTFDQMAAASPQLACSKLAQVSASASAATSAFKGICSGSYSSCQSACASDLQIAQAAQATNPDAAAAIEDIRSNRKRCENLANSLQAAIAEGMKYAATSQNMTFCQTQTGDTFAEYCAKTPADPFCANRNTTTDCTDLACICYKNPNDPKCGSSNNFARKSNGSAVDGSSTDGLSGFGDLNGDFGSGMNDFGDGVPSQPAGGSLNRGGSGGGGGGISGGGGSRGGGGGAVAGGGGSGLNTKILGGYGVGGRGGGSYGSGGGSNDQTAMQAMNGRNGYGAGGRNAGVDLKQFLPGGKQDPSRGLAGISGPDGITGPNSSIWQKIKIRYYSISPSLLP